MSDFYEVLAEDGQAVLAEDGAAILAETPVAAAAAPSATPRLLARLLTRPCTLVRRVPATADAYGDPTWSEAHTVTLCYAEQAAPSEPGDPHYQGDEWRFVLDASAVVDGLDAIDLEGRRFEVVGPPWMAKDPRANLDHHWELRATWRAS